MCAEEEGEEGQTTKKARKMVPHMCFMAAVQVRVDVIQHCSAAYTTLGFAVRRSVSKSPMLSRCLSASLFWVNIERD